MRVLISADLPRHRQRGLRRDLRATIGAGFQGKVVFVQQPETIGQVCVTVELATGEQVEDTLFTRVTPLVDTAATLQREAKCILRNCGSTPKITWHRWSDRKDSFHWL